MNRSILAVCFLGLGYTAGAQDKQFTMSEAVTGMYTNLVREDISQLKWMPTENAYVKLTKGSADQALVKITVPQDRADTLLRLSALKKQHSSFSGLRTLPTIEWFTNTSGYFQLENDFYTISIEGGKATTTLWTSLPASAENVSVDLQKKQIAYTIGNNLYLNTGKDKQLAITRDTAAGVVNGKSVHRQEFGIDKGIFFSPSGNLLAYYHMDESMVEQYPLINWDAIPASMHYTRYPFAGRTSHVVKLAVYNINTRKTILLDTGTPADHYLTGVCWSPDEKKIYVGILNREQNHLWLNRYSAGSGALEKTLFEETDSKYVQPLHTMAFIDGKPDEFIWWSARDGYTHLYRYNTSGKLLNQITKGPWVVNELLGQNTAKKQLYFLSAKESPKDKNVYSVNWNNGKITRLDNATGIHAAFFANSGNYYIDRYSNATTPRNIILRSVDGKLRTTLLEAKDPLKAYTPTRVENITLKADDGTPLYGKLIYPSNFNPAKKYPTIVYLYNGPNVQLITNNYPASGNLWYDYMAQHGYIIFTMDGRGSANRGQKFEQVTFRQLGTVELQDQMQGVNYLKSLPFVDAGRLGIHGWSFGGFMTTSFMLRYPGVFKCAVAGGPVMDWKMYEVMYTERYMDTPQENPSGYADANLLTKVKNLKGKLMVIHGSIDSTVVLQNSMLFLKESVKNGVQVDFFEYPGHEHNVRGYDRIHLMQKVTDYFDKNL